MKRMKRKISLLWLLVFMVFSGLTQSKSLSYNNFFTKNFTTIIDRFSTFKLNSVSENQLRFISLSLANYDSTNYSFELFVEVGYCSSVFEKYMNKNMTYYEYGKVIVILDNSFNNIKYAPQPSFKSISNKRLLEFKNDFLNCDKAIHSGLSSVDVICNRHLISAETIEGYPIFLLIPDVK